MDLVSKVVTGLKEDTLFCAAEVTIPNGFVLPTFFESFKKSSGHFITMIMEKEDYKVIKILRFRESAPWQQTKKEKDGFDEVQFV